MMINPDRNKFNNLLAAIENSDKAIDILEKNGELLHNKGHYYMLLNIVNVVRMHYAFYAPEETQPLDSISENLFARIQFHEARAIELANIIGKDSYEFVTNRCTNVINAANQLGQKVPEAWLKRLFMEDLCEQYAKNAPGKFSPSFN